MSDAGKRLITAAQEARELATDQLVMAAARLDAALCNFCNSADDAYTPDLWHEETKRNFAELCAAYNSAYSAGLFPGRLMGHLLSKDRELAAVAAAYETAARQCTDNENGPMPHWASIGTWVESRVRAGLAIRNLISDDGVVALDQMLDEARKEGMRQAAAIANAEAQTTANMTRVWRNGCEDAAAAILAEAEK